ncbi:hypothetical protein TW95_gp0101 [Pandoravirus inopinatum]|uniref:Uncharacterized protein n=1 Tax=Pandoravirus inopinatum TaxID=1605721 RepID=A0A0B5J5B6_9VIRU|nr:hypothetical protein TW95_gp0101 [Pandoravirus inopinatum]AJF96835.1 hypothetical protein [Pandoravirus inopinatum]
MFWRRARTKARKASDAAPATATTDAHREPTRPSYDDVDYWEAKLNPWLNPQTATERDAQAWPERRGAGAMTRTSASTASTTHRQGVGECIVEPPDAPYAAGFTIHTGLITPAAFDARIPREARLVLTVGETHVPVAFDVREVVGAVEREGLLRSEVATCLMGETDLVRARATARMAREQEIARLLFQPPRVEAVVDPYGAWGLVAAREARSTRHPAPTRGPGLPAVALGVRPAAAMAGVGGVPAGPQPAYLRRPPAFSVYDDVTARDMGYIDMYGGDDDDVQDVDYEGDDDDDDDGYDN